MTIPYQPKVGEMVRVVLYGTVKTIEITEKGAEIGVWVNIGGDKQTFCCGIPMVCAEPFDPIRAMEVFEQEPEDHQEGFSAN